jgi:Flp pilus assembly pilin Flp
MELLKRLVTEEEGQDIVEYALMIGLVVVVIWVAVKATGVDTSVSNIWSKVGSSLNSTGGS